MKKKIIFGCLFIIAISIIFSACGGGGGGGSSIFGASGLGYTDLFNNHVWEYVNGSFKITLSCDNSKMTCKFFIDGVEQPGTTTSSYELKDVKELGKTGKIKCQCINNGAETEFAFNKLIAPETVTMNFNGTSITFTKK